MEIKHFTGDMLTSNSIFLLPQGGGLTERRSCQGEFAAPVL